MPQATLSQQNPGPLRPQVKIDIFCLGCHTRFTRKEHERRDTDLVFCGIASGYFYLHPACADRLVEQGVLSWQETDDAQ
jgi:hypothetical protein